MTCDKCLKRDDCPLRGITEIIDKSIKRHDNIEPIRCKERTTVLGQIMNKIYALGQ